MTLLDAVLFLPLIGFFLLLLIPKSNPGLSRMAALVISLLIFVISLGLVSGLSPDGYSFVHDSEWISSPPIRYHVGLDGLSLWLVILTTLLTPISVLASWKHIDHRVKEFFAFLILLEFGLIGVFISLDLFLFYVFWEIGLVPMYFLIGIWGHDRRIYAAVKFFIYTFTGSVLMLAAIIFLYNRAGTFDYTQIVAQLQSGRLALSSQVEMILFLAFFIAFAIKVPLFPLHTWLPDAHVEAPTAGSIMLASVMLKMGTYGLVRFCLPLFPNAAHKSAPWVIALAVIGIIYGALVALVQPNMKKLVAYSSVSHLGFVVLGIFSFTQQGLDGAVYQMLNHGISTGALFMLVGFLYERRHSLEISAYGGVATPAPNLAIVFLIATLASVGLPMLNNFVGEYSGAARRIILKLYSHRVRRHRRHPFRVLHAVAVSTNILRKTIRIAKPSHAGLVRTRVGRHPAAAPLDAVDGHLHPNLPTLDQRAERANSGPEQRASGRQTNSGRKRGGECPLTCSPPASNTSASCRK